MLADTIQKKCPVSGLEIIESRQWSNLKLSENYIISFRKIGSQIVDVHGYGNVSDFNAKRFQGYLDRFIIEMQVESPYVEIRNYEDLGGIFPTRETMKSQKDYFINNREKRIGFVAYNAKSAIAMLLQSGARQYSKYRITIDTVENYEQAIKKAQAILNDYKYNRVNLRKPKKYKITSDDIDKVALFCGQLLWEDGLYDDIEEIKLDTTNPLHPIIENLIILREELMSLEADSLKKARALEIEMYQTEKIVESLQSGVLILNSTGVTIIDVNPVACKMLCCEKELLIGKQFSQFFEEKFNSYQSYSYNKGVTESTLITCEGDKIPVMRSSVPIKLGGKDFILENLVDISSAKKHEEKLKKSLAHTKQLNNLTFNREKRIIEMKMEVNRLLEDAGKPPKYRSVLNMQKDEEYE